MSVLYSPTLKHSDGELRRNPELDSSNIGHPQQHCHQINSGLLRFRSAPSSFLANLVESSSHGCVNEEAFRGEYNHRRFPPSSSPEMETMLAKLMSSNEFGGKPVKQEETEESVLKQSGYSYGSQMIYNSQQIQGFPNGSLSSGNGFDGSFSAVNSMASSENSTQSKMGSRNSSNLIRQKSSPAGFFNDSPLDNGFAVLREVGSYGGCDISNGQATTPRRMPYIPENGNESLEPSDFWDVSSFNDQKTPSGNDEFMFSTSDAFETQNVDFGYQNLGLTHHLSLPSSSTNMGAIEKFLQIQGSAPCKIRAKRGFATHPRSIAERVRRTRISERIKKLQELFPKSDKQTSTAEMLDVAVEYIKDLKKQVKILTDTKAKCKCSSNQKQNSRPCA